VIEITPESTAKFWQAIDTTSGECWTWTRAHNGLGYGVFTFQGQREYAHRFAYRQLIGDIPAGYYVLHQCDNPPCVRHLFTGTQKDNLHDCSQKGHVQAGADHWARRMPERMVRGEAHPNTHLTADLVRAIRNRYAAGGVSMHQLAREYHVSSRTILQIIHRRVWAHVA
jgi:hypothetical protein